MSYSPTKLILFFFVAVIALGAMVLSLPVSRAAGPAYSLIDNLFTASSAVCVTGLTTVDIGTYYTLFGQIVILALLQIGGLGYMTLSTLVGLFIGRIALKDRMVIKELLDVQSFSSLLALLKKIVTIVLIIEAIGAAYLTSIFSLTFPLPQALYYGVFHGISAFCNAGLSPFGNSLEGFSDSWSVLLPVSLLIIFGGLGFIVLVELWDLAWGKLSRLSLHSRIVLLMSAVLIASGLAGFWAFEGGNVLKGHTAGYGLLNSYFHSVTARTAGFDAISNRLHSPATALMTMVLMFIGASPGGTGGGIKTPTAVMVFLFTLAMIRGWGAVNVWERRIAFDLINKALAIFILSLSVVIASTTLLVLTQPHPFIDCLFEATSAFGTVGLSRGLTSGLDGFGKLLIVSTMIVGRIGPLAFLTAILKKEAERTSIRYPEERIMIG